MGSLLKSQNSITSIRLQRNFIGLTIKRLDSKLHLSPSRTLKPAATFVLLQCLEVLAPHRSGDDNLLKSSVLPGTDTSTDLVSRNNKHLSEFKLKRTPKNFNIRRLNGTVTQSISKRNTRFKSSNQILKAAQNLFRNRKRRISNGLLRRTPLESINNQRVLMTREERLSHAHHAIAEGSCQKLKRVLMKEDFPYGDFDTDAGLLVIHALNVMEKFGSHRTYKLLQILKQELDECGLLISEGCVETVTSPLTRYLELSRDSFEEHILRSLVPKGSTAAIEQHIREAIGEAMGIKCIRAVEYLIVNYMKPKQRKWVPFALKEALNLYTICQLEQPLVFMLQWWRSLQNNHPRPNSNTSLLSTSSLTPKQPLLGIYGIDLSDFDRGELLGVINSSDLPYVNEFITDRLLERDWDHANVTSRPMLTVQDKAIEQLIKCYLVEENPSTIQAIIGRNILKWYTINRARPDHSVKIPRHSLTTMLLRDLRVEFPRLKNILPHSAKNNENLICVLKSLCSNSKVDFGQLVSAIGAVKIIQKDVSIDHVENMILLSLKSLEKKNKLENFRQILVNKLRPLLKQLQGARRSNE